MIDLHCHTTNSDGDYTTEETLLEAEKNKIEILSITDHNNISAYNDIERLKLRNIFSGKIIYGTELEFTDEGRIFEVLGYGFDANKLKNSEIIEKGMIHSTIEGETIILNKLKTICDKLGIKYSKNLKITSAHYMANDVLVDNILLFSENKEILDQIGIYDRSSFYRMQFCCPGKEFYINRTGERFSLEYVCNTIHEAGGKVFFAHPFVYKIPDLEEYIEKLKNKKFIDGIECKHRKHNEEQIKWLMDYCRINNLLMSGGSDRHTQKHKMGYANNNQLPIDIELVENWVNDKSINYI